MTRIPPRSTRTEHTLSLHDALPISARLDWFGLAPDLIKYDVQGHEVRALKGSIETLKRHKPVVIVECWRDGERDNGPRHLLESIGASLVESVGKDLILDRKSTRLNSSH